MTNIYLLKNYKGNVAGSIIKVSDAEATTLIQLDTARLTFGSDYLVKPSINLRNVVSRAFRRSPEIK